MRTFKIMNEGYPLVSGVVPWEFIASGADQALRNHGQSLERLNERGGLSVIEALAALENRPIRPINPMDKTQASRLFLHYLREFNDRDAIMPGAWYCPQCDFRLQKSVLHAGDGSVSANTSPLNVICPNDGQMMKPLTWRMANEGWVKMVDARSAELDQCKTQLEAWHSQFGTNQLTHAIAKMEALQKSKDVWRAYAAHLEHCPICASDISDCEKGSYLKGAAEADKGTDNERAGSETGAPGAVRQHRPTNPFAGGPPALRLRD